MHMDSIGSADWWKMRFEETKSWEMERSGSLKLLPTGEGTLILITIVRLLIGIETGCKAWLCPLILPHNGGNYPSPDCEKNQLWPSAIFAFLIVRLARQKPEAPAQPGWEPKKVGSTCGSCDCIAKLARRLGCSVLITIFFTWLNIIASCINEWAPHTQEMYFTSKLAEASRAFTLSSAA